MVEEEKVLRSDVEEKEVVEEKMVEGSWRRRKC